MQALEPRKLLHGGFLDPTFGDGGSVVVGAGGSTIDVPINPEPDVVDAGNGRYVVLSRRSNPASGTTATLTRLAHDGTIDPTFGVGGTVVFSSPGESVVLRSAYRLPDGSFVLVGRRSGNTSSNALVARVGANGEAVGTSPFVEVPGMWLDSIASTQVADGRIYVVGEYLTPDSERVPGLFRLTSTGALDTTFGANGFIALPTRTQVGEIAADQMIGRSDGGVLIRTNTQKILAFDANGAADLAFGTNGMLDLSNGGSRRVDAIAEVGGPAAGFYALISDFSTPTFGTYLYDFNMHGGSPSIGVRLPIFDSAGLGSSTTMQLRVSEHAGPYAIVLPANGTEAHIHRLLPDGRADVSFGLNGQLRIVSPDPATSGATSFRPVSAMVDASGDVILVTNYATGSTTESGSEARLPKLLRIKADSDIEPGLQGPSTVDEGTSFNLSLNPSLPAGVSVVGVEWSRDVSSHFFTADSSFNGTALAAGHGASVTPGVRLTLSDGTIIAQALTVPVRNIAPTVGIRVTQFLRGENTPAVYVADGADPSLTVTFDWGDPSGRYTYPSGGNEWFSYAYRNAGNYVLKVSAKDDQDTTTVQQSVSAFDFAFNLRLDVNRSLTRDAGDTNLAGFRVVVDTNKNGVIDPGETQVLSSDPTRTLAGQALPTGQLVQFIIVPPPGYALVGPNVMQAMNSQFAEANPVINLLATRSTVITSLAFVDVNGDGTQGGLGEVSLAAYLDLDGDGVFDLDEPVSLQPAGSSTFFIQYERTLPAGTYVVRTLPASASSYGTAGPVGARPAFSFTVDGSSGGRAFTATLATPLRNALLRPIAFVDANGDGVRQPDEVDLPGVFFFEDRINLGTYDHGAEAYVIGNNSLFGLATTPGTLTAVRSITPVGFALTTPTVQSAVPTTNTSTAPQLLFGFRPLGVDVTAPQVVRVWLDTSVRPAMLRVRFSEDVRFASDPIFSSVISAQQPNGAWIAPSVFDNFRSRSYDPQSATLSFGMLPTDLVGVGAFRVNVSNFADRAGNAGSPATIDAAFLPGDLTGDGSANFDDLLILAKNYNQSARTYAQGNLDFDPFCRVDFDDLLILAKHYNISLAHAAIAEPSGATSTSTIRKRTTSTQDLLA